MVKWDKIKKRVKELKLIPKGVFFPNYDFETVKHHIICSVREIGKTTSLLIFGLVGYEMCGLQTIYVRETTEMRYPKNTRGLFNVVKENGYIEKIFNNKWNDVLLSSRYWYLVRRDEKGNVVEKDINPFCIMVSIEEHEELKSSLNYPLGDLIIVDEFIGKRYRYNEFFMLQDLIKTIIRQRTSAVIFYLANDIDYTSEYFAEFECDEIIKDMKLGDDETYKTEKGTKVHLALLGVAEDVKESREQHNLMYFGFKNPMLSSITGNTEWAFADYPKQYSDLSPIERRIYLRYNGLLVRCDIVTDNNNRLLVFCHKATKFYEDSYILVNVQPMLKNEFYYYGDNVCRFLVDMYSKNRVIFSNNKIGHIFDKFFNVSRNDFL